MVRKQQRSELLCWLYQSTGYLSPSLQPQRHPVISLACSSPCGVGGGRGGGEAKCPILSKPVTSEDFEKLRNNQHDEGNLV